MKLCKSVWIWDKRVCSLAIPIYIYDAFTQISMQCGKDFPANIQSRGEILGRSQESWKDRQTNSWVAQGQRGQFRTALMGAMLGGPFLQPRSPLRDINKSYTCWRHLPAIGCVVGHLVWPFLKNNFFTGISWFTMLRLLQVYWVRYTYTYTYACWLSCFSCVRLCVTPWTVAHQAPLSLGSSRQEHWSGSPRPPPGDRPDPGIQSTSPAFAARFFTAEPPGRPAIAGATEQV